MLVTSKKVWWLFWSIILLIYPMQASAITLQRQFQLTVPNTAVQVSGYTSPNSLVIIKDGGTTIGSTTSSVTGQFIGVYNRPAGIRNITVMSTDPGNNITNPITKSISLQPQQTTNVDFLLPPTLEYLGKTPSSLSSSSQFRGYGTPGGTITLFNNNQRQIAQTIVNSSGIFEFIIANGSIGIGQYSFSAKITKDGNSSESSNTQAVSIVSDRNTSEFDTIVVPTGISRPSIFYPSSGVHIEGNKVTITGSADPNSQVNIYVNNIIAGSVLADLTGYWEFTYYATTTPISVSVESCIGSVCSLRSDSIVINFDKLSKTCRQDIRLKEYRFWDILQDTPIKLQTDIQDLKKVSINWGDGVEEVFNASGPEQNYMHSYKQSGSYNGSIVFRDNNCNTTRYFSVTVIDQQATNNYLLIIISIIITFLAILGTRKILGKNGNE